MDNEASFENKRHFSRIVFDTEVHLVSAEGSWTCRLIDISFKGILVTEPTNWHANIGDHFLAELLMGNNETVIRMEVSVTHIEDGHAGFRCEHIDLDSVSHLRRLVELNIGNTEILNRELSELGNRNS